MKLKILAVVVILGVIGVTFFFWQKRQAELRLADTCPQDKFVTLDLDKSSYTNTDVFEVVGSVPSVLRAAHLEYDLVSYTDAMDIINEWDVIKDQVYSPANNRHTGWQKVKLNSTFTIRPQFPDAWKTKSYSGIYFRVVCADGTHTPDVKLTRMAIDRHLIGGRLYAVSSNNPLTQKYFK